jgi:Protein of unknown function (DUF3489)
MTKAPTKPRKTSKTAIRAEDTQAAETASVTTPKAAATSPLNQPRQTKASLLRSRLSDPGGVSMAALMEMTGWQAHTLRAALSGLRKDGLTLTRRREGEETIYAIAAGAAVAAEAVVTPTEASTGAEVPTVPDAEPAIQVTGALV